MENVFGLMALIIFGFIVIAIGVFGARASKKTAVDYLLAGREIGIFVMFFYVAFVIYSAWTFYGYPGFLYLSGPPYMMFALAAHIAFSFIYFGIGPRIWAMGKMYELVSPLEFLEGRYESRAVRTITAIVLTLFIIPYIGLQCVGSAVGFKAVSG